MLGLGFWEIVVIVLIALVVVGPERLPSFARSIGRFLNDIKRTASGLKSSLDQGEDVFAGNLDSLQKKRFCETVVFHKTTGFICVR